MSVKQTEKASALWVIRNKADLDAGVHSETFEYEATIDAPLALPDWRSGPYQVHFWESRQEPGIPYRVCLRVLKARGLHSNYDHWLALELASLFSLFLGKRLTVDRFVRSDDTPYLIPLPTPARPNLDTSVGSRVPGSVPGTIDPYLFLEPISLSTVGPALDQLFLLKAELHERFYLAARAYHHAVLNIEVDPGFSYIQLITAIEALSFDWPINQTIKMIDGTLENLLAQLEDSDLRGQIESRFLRLTRVGQKFVGFVLDHIDATFWTERQRPVVGGLDSSKLADLLVSTYSARSKTLHEGTLFPSNSLFPPLIEFQEHVPGCAAPLVSFFERLTRYVLLRYLSANASVSDQPAPT